MVRHNEGCLISTEVRGNNLERTHSMIMHTFYVEIENACGRFHVTFNGLLYFHSFGRFPKLTIEIKPTL